MSLYGQHQGVYECHKGWENCNSGTEQALLKIENCMYELSGIMENVNYKDRMLPVVVDDTIRDDDFYVELVKHWKEKKDKQTEIVEKLRDLDPDMAEPEEMKLKEIEQVYGLLKVIKEYIDWANADNLDALSSS